MHACILELETDKTFVLKLSVQEAPSTCISRRRVASGEDRERRRIPQEAR